MVAQNVSTDQVRRWYPEANRRHHLRGTPGVVPSCNFRTRLLGGPAVKILIPRQGGGFFSEPVHWEYLDGWSALVEWMIYHDQSITGAGGVDNCRNIAGTWWPSLHAYLAALDNPPNSRWSRQFLAAVQGVLTIGGPAGPERVWRNLPNDRMHLQANASPAAMLTGIDPRTLPAGSQPPEPPHEEDQMIELNDKGRAVAEAQELLISAGIDIGDFDPYVDPRDQSRVFPPGADGEFGARSVDGTKEYQGRKDVDVTGVIDGFTMSILTQERAQGDHVHKHNHDGRYTKISAFDQHGGHVVGTSSP